MENRTRIVVSTDFSEASRQPYAAAASLARRFEAELYLVHQVEILPVLPQPWPAESVAAADLNPEKIAGELRRGLEKVAASDPLFQGIEVRPHLLEAGGAEGFARFLSEEGVDLLVMGTHGRTGIRRFLLGSYTEKMLRLAPCPVLVYRRPDGRPAGVEFAPRRILVPCDFSPSSRRAEEWACRWARAFDARVRLLYVIERDTGVLGVAKDVVGGWMKYLEEVRGKARAELEAGIAERWKGVDVAAEIAVGHPVLEILENEESFAADLVVMGTHGTTGIRHFLLGSVTERTVRKSACPVLVVHAAEAEAAPEA